MCGICHTPADPAFWHKDHIIPTSRGGRDVYSNVQVSHPLCNLKKGSQFLAPLKKVYGTFASLCGFAILVGIVVQGISISTHPHHDTLQEQACKRENSGESAFGNTDPTLLTDHAWCENGTVPTPKAQACDRWTYDHGNSMNRIICYGR